MIALGLIFALTVAVRKSAVMLTLLMVAIAAGASGQTSECARGTRSGDEVTMIADSIRVVDSVATTLGAKIRRLGQCGGTTVSILRRLARHNRGRSLIGAPSTRRHIIWFRNAVTWRFVFRFSQM